MPDDATNEPPGDEQPPPGDGHPPRSGLVDWAELEAQFKGKTSFVTGLASKALAGYLVQAARLRAIADGDGALAELAFIAHSVKGSAGALKLTAIHELAAATDQAAHASHETARQLATELAAQLDLLIPELEARTATASPSGALREPPKPLQ